MAVLYITEYAEAGTSGGMAIGVGSEPPITEQTVAIAVGSNQSNAFTKNTKLVRIHADAICSIAFGTNPTATATNRRLAANQTEYFDLKNSPGFKVAVIQNT